MLDDLTISPNARRPADVRRRSSPPHEARTGSAPERRTHAETEPRRSAPRTPPRDDAAEPRAAAASEPPRLTARETEILELIAYGMAVKGISERLNCAESTVRRRISGICKKTGSRNRAEAVRFFEEHLAPPHPRAATVERAAGEARPDAAVPTRPDAADPTRGHARAAPERTLVAVAPRHVPARQSRPSAMPAAPKPYRVAAVAALASGFAVLVLTVVITLAAGVGVFALAGPVLR
jgi:DNA-binding CsgD family transcriptional regulator